MALITISIINVIVALLVEQKVGLLLYSSLLSIFFLFLLSLLILIIKTVGYIFSKIKKTVRSIIKDTKPKINKASSLKKIALFVTSAPFFILLVFAYNYEKYLISKNVVCGYDGCGIENNASFSFQIAAINAVFYLILLAVFAKIFNRVSKS